MQSRTAKKCPIINASAYCATKMQWELCQFFKFLIYSRLYQIRSVVEMQLKHNVSMPLVP